MANVEVWSWDRHKNKRGILLDSFWTLTLPSRRPEVERDACFGIRLFQPYKPYILFDALSVPIPIDQRVELIIGAMFVEQRLPSP